MSHDLVANEPLLRLAAFVGVFALMWLWEWRAPGYPRRIGRKDRWPGNLGILLLDTAIVRLVFPVAVVGIALAGEQHGWGLFQAYIELPAWIEIVACIGLMDLAIYLQHVLFHSIPVLWRLHRMHHADLELDFTTGIRFHPIEIVMSALIKVAVVAALGVPAVAVVLFEIMLNASSMFNHGSVRIPPGVERALRLIVVTPEMHRVHHSIDRHETNSNFGFNHPWWDRLFGTYRAAPAAGLTNMTIGIEQFRDVGESRLDRLVTQPFRDDAKPTAS